MRSEHRAMGRQEVNIMATPFAKYCGFHLFNPFKSKYQKWAQRHIFLLSTLAFFFIITWVLEVVTKYVL
jgi:hypothetical protein